MASQATRDALEAENWDPHAAIDQETIQDIDQQFVDLINTDGNAVSRRLLLSALTFSVDEWKQKWNEADEETEEMLLDLLKCGGDVMTRIESYADMLRSAFARIATTHKE